MTFQRIIYGFNKSENMIHATEYSLISIIIQALYIFFENTIIKYYIRYIVKLAIPYINTEVYYLIAVLLLIISVYFISFSGKTSHLIEIYVLIISIITFFSNFIAFIPLIAAWIKIRDEYFERKGVKYY